MPKYVFRYFPSKALGESVRLLLAYNGDEFEDVHIKYPEDWPNEKSKTPFGQVPTLEIDGKVYSQSAAISRYLGKKCGLGGATLEEDLEIDQIVDTYHDLRAKAAAAHYEKDPETQKRRYDEIQPVLPVLLGKLDDIAKANNGHVALGKLTWGDFMVAGMYDYIKDMSRLPDLDKQYPNIEKIVAKVYSLPKVQAWVAKRQPLVRN